MTIRLQDARVLDLFAGTGALGIEAVSRGAAFALFVDNGAEARALLRNNVEALGPRRRDQGLSPRRHQSRPGASDGAVLAGVPRSALRQGTRREGAGLVARWRLADVGARCWWSRKPRPRNLRRPMVSRSWSGGRMTIRSLCSCALGDLTSDRHAPRKRGIQYSGKFEIISSAATCWIVRLRGR